MQPGDARRWFLGLALSPALLGCRAKGERRDLEPSPSATPSPPSATAAAERASGDVASGDAAASMGAPTVLRQSRKLTTRAGKCYFDISYPELRFARDPKLEASLNRALRAEFVDQTLKVPDCEGLPDAHPLRGPHDPNDSSRGAKQQDSFDLYVDYDVKLNQAGLLSIKYDGLMSYSLSAHPTKIYKAVNFDLVTGEPISYASVWKPGSKFARRVDQLISEVLDRDKIGVEPPQKGSHDFYLTRSALVIFNVFDNFAFGSVEAAIPLARLSSILDPEGPLTRLGTSAALESSKFVRLTPEEQDRIVRPELRPGEAIAHQVFRGPFGPSNEAIVVVTERELKYAGFVLVPDSGGMKKLPLPLLHDAWSGFDVAAVSFEDVDGDGVRELIVMAEYMTGIGPKGSQPFHWNTVVAFRDGRFVRLPEVEKAIERADTAAQVKKIVSTIREQSGPAKTTP
jgi:hypothetical protein